MSQNNQIPESKTLWIGDLQPWMDQNTISQIISSMGYQVHSVKLIRDKQTNSPPKYGFVQFKTKQFASAFYKNFNGSAIPNYSHKVFKLNWSTYGTTKASQIITIKPSVDIQIYIGDLSTSITEHKLLQCFKPKYPSAYMAKIITDTNTKISKGYGFIKFSNQQDANKAISQMNGVTLGDKQIKVSQAYQKSKDQVQEVEQQSQTQAAQRIKLYQNFYSMMNDPIMKAQYERQLQKTFNLQGKKPTLKQNYENVKTLSYSQTLKSQQFLKHLPKMIGYESKLSVQRKMYS